MSGAFLETSRSHGGVNSSTRLAFAAIAFALLCDPSCSRADVLTEAQERGKTVYITGVSPRGHELAAEIAGGIKLSAEFHPCTQCHRIDGDGGPEGGIMVPKIVWKHLTAAHGVQTYLGGRRPPYDEATIGRAIRQGRDSGGEPLDPLMPRYGISDDDLADLLAYLKILGKQAAPGTTDDKLRIATLVPLSGPLAIHGRSLVELLADYFESVNAAGGIHDRLVEFVGADAGVDTDSALAKAGELLEQDGSVFCFVANAGPAASPEFLEKLSAQAVPVIGPLTFANAQANHVSAFLLLPSLADQARALALYLAHDESRTNDSVALVAGHGTDARAMADAFAVEARRLELPLDRAIWDKYKQAATVTAIRQAQAKDLVFFGDATQAEAILKEAGRQDWSPRLLASSVLLSGKVETGGSAMVLVTPPTLASPSHPGADEFTGLLRGHADTSSRTMHMAAFAAAKVTVEAVRLAGRRLHRETFVDMLQGFRDFETGVMPPVTFSVNRHAGVRGALVISFDDDGTVVGSEWVSTDETF